MALWVCKESWPLAVDPRFLICPTSSFQKQPFDSIYEQLAERTKVDRDGIILSHRGSKIAHGSLTPFAIGIGEDVTFGAFVRVAYSADMTLDLREPCTRQTHTHLSLGARSRVERRLRGLRGWQRCWTRPTAR
jgi:hypothetical protein